MVDTLVSGASASRHVGSSPIIRTKKEADFDSRPLLVFIGMLMLCTEVLLCRFSRCLCYQPAAMLSAICFTSLSLACTLAHAA